MATAAPNAANTGNYNLETRIKMPTKISVLIGLFVVMAMDLCVQAGANGEIQNGAGLSDE